MRSVSAIAIDLPEGSTKPGDFSGLLARLEEILHDASGDRDGQPPLVPMRVVITFGSPALNAPSQPMDRDTVAVNVPLLSGHSASMLRPDALDQFPSEPLERASDRAMTRPRRDGAGIFTFADETPATSSFAQAPARGVVRSRDDLDHFEASPDLHDIPRKMPTRADRLVDGARRRLRDLTATMTTRSRGGLAAIKVVIRRARVAVQGVRSLRSAAMLLFRSLWMPCVAAALVGIQAGGSSIAPAPAARALAVGAAQAVSVPASAPASRTVPRIEPAPVPVPAAATKPVRSAIVKKPAAVAQAAPRATPVQSLSAPSVQSAAKNTDGPAAAAAMTGSLVIESEPSGAHVFMNQRPVGVTPVVLSDVRAGAYAIQVQMAGYTRWSRGIYVVVDQRTLVAAQLERERR